MTAIRAFTGRESRMILLGALAAYLGIAFAGSILAGFAWNAIA